MDAVKSFFQKYSAVPVNDAGPMWPRASDAALLEWAQDDCNLWDRTLPEAHREHLRARMQEIGNELWARMHKDSDEPEIPLTVETDSTPTVMRRMCRLWNLIFVRIGFQYATSAMPKRARGN